MAEQSHSSHGRGALPKLLQNVLGRFDKPVPTPSKFVDLAPTDKADSDGVYSDALFFATNNPRVSNIALTGPYGSGKSSIIESFLAKYSRPVLQISLAAFLPDPTSSSAAISKQEIERSILQQMLYGEDASKLPLSRFKRIHAPGQLSFLVSLIIICGITSLFYIFRQTENILNGSYFVPFAPSNWLHIATFAFGATFLWVAVHRIYVASFSFSLKSISLKDVEITPANANQESILNRHLDEIIYFFQSTHYDLVVIEDLDRFEQSDIFVTLREINSLINANSGINRKIRFLYALRDDMFTNIDRTKFFEFIIPVIPIINTSNSIDKVLEQGERLALDDRLDRQFLREVSRYLNDLRLIRNIFNEYAIYVANLETGDETILNPDKLLAVLIYKNVFPRDFENLHKGKGVLSTILKRHDEFIALEEAELKASISRLEGQVERARKQLPIDVHELRRIYAMALIEKLPAATTHVGINWHSLVALGEITRHESFDRLLEAGQVMHRTGQGNQDRSDISSLQAEVDATKTFQQRKEEVEHKSVEFVEAAAKSVQGLRARISTLRTTKFNEVVRLNAAALDEHFQELGEDSRLAKFLVLEGFLDDTYYQYTSLFHSGRLSPSDNKFLIQIRDFSNPEPDFQVDNPKEVIAAMRAEDFRQPYVLNVKIVDCLLADPSIYAVQTAGLLELIAREFHSCEHFLSTYYATGAKVSELLAKLSQMWAGFIPQALASSKSLLHVTHLAAHLPLETLRTLPDKQPALSRYVSANLPEILASAADMEPTRLAAMKIEVANLASVDAFGGVSRFLFEEGLYSLNIDNVEFIFRSLLGVDDVSPLRTQHYTTVLKSSNIALLERIENRFPAYLKGVILKLEENSQESASAIQALIAHDSIDPDDAVAFLAKQTAVLPSLQEVPAHLRSAVFQLFRIEASWTNCLAFLSCEEFDAESLTAYLNAGSTLATLAGQAIPDGKDAYPLRQFLIGNDGLQDDVYRTYVRLLPKQFPNFPESIGTSKTGILIEEKRVTFSPENLDSLSADRSLQILFVARNIELYLAKTGAYSIDDDFREALLGSEVADHQKLSIVQSMDLSALASAPERAGAVGIILERTGADLSMLDPDAARAVILNSSPVYVQIALLNKSREILDNTAVREILAMLPKPYSEITTGYHIPVLDMNERNVELATWLNVRDVISSWSKGLFGDTIRINLRRR